MNKNKNIVPKKGPAGVSQDHWQINTDITPQGNNSGWGAFLPRKGKDRPTPYVKINECDH